MSFRARLLGAALSTLAIGLAALVIAGNVLLGHRIDREEAGLLRARVQAEVASLTIKPERIIVRETANDAELDRQSWVLNRSRVVERPPGVDAALDHVAVTLARGGGAREIDGPGDLRLRVEPLVAPGSSSPTGAVVVGLSVAPLERVEQEVLIGSLIIATFVLVAGAVVTSSAVSGALRPVAEMTERATDWGSHDLDRRFDLGPPRDELTGLAATLDSLLSRIAASRRHEQRFASEVAHELRTPLAGILARAELALTSRSPDAADERTAALQAIVAQAQRLDEAIDTLIAMARREPGQPSAATDAATVAREFEDVAVNAPPDLPRVEGEPEVLRRTLSPLIDNARRHARTSVSISLAAGPGTVLIEVRDDGPGFDPAVGDRVFDPGYQGAPGTGAGLGMALTRRLARSCGGDTHLGHGAGGCVIVELPAAST